MRFAGERNFRSGSEPSVPIQSLGYRLAGNSAHWLASLAGQASGRIDAADDTLFELLDPFDNSRDAPVLGTVLDDASVLVRRLHDLAPLEDVVGAGLLHKYILTRLASPNGAERVPVIGCGEANDVDRRIVKDRAHIRNGGGLSSGALFVFGDALPEGGFVHIAERHEFDIPRGQFVEACNVALAATPEADDSGANAVVRALAVGRQRWRARGRQRSLEETAAISHGNLPPPDSIQWRATCVVSDLYS